MALKQLRIAFLLAAALLLFQVVALRYSLFWVFRWLDIPMHIFGGMALGAFVLAFISRRHVFIYFGSILAVAISWEIFEYLFNISAGEPGYWLDTIKDIIDGLIGSGIMLTLSKTKLWRSN